jgi:hypothetical protein
VRITNRETPHYVVLSSLLLFLLARPQMFVSTALLDTLNLFKDKVHSRTGYEDPEGEWMYSSTLSLTLVLSGGEWSTPRPGRFTPGKVTRYTLYRRLGGPQCRSGRMRKISPPPPGFDPWTVQSVALYRRTYPGPFLSLCYFLNVIQFHIHVACKITAPCILILHRMVALSPHLICFIVSLLMQI